jgi:hypothetical protein
MFLPSLEKATIKIATQEARRQAAIVVVATAQYSLTSNGRLPKDIHDLVPEFLPLLPLDTFDGEPLRYKQLPSGFVVYSVGADRIDDGGKERPPKGRQQNFDITFIVER